MSETPEVPTQAQMPVIIIGQTGTSVLLALAAYGSAQLTHDAIRLTKKVHRNRKVARALKKEQKNRPQQ